MEMKQKLILKTILFGLMGIFLIVVACQKEDSPKEKKVIKDIPYKVVRQWTLPNGGYGKEIAIDPKYRNDSDLKALGEKLKEENKGERNAFIGIFDDSRAAQMHRDAVAEKVSKKDLKFHDDHMLGEYTKNGNTGFHKLEYGLKGFMNDPIVEVKY